MGVLGTRKQYAAPTKEQRERYMKGETEEIHFGPEGQIVLILYTTGSSILKRRHR